MKPGRRARASKAVNRETAKRRLGREPRRDAAACERCFGAIPNGFKAEGSTMTSGPRSRELRIFRGQRGQGWGPLAFLYVVYTLL